MELTNSKRLFSTANHFIPGGVNSPVRAFKGVGGDPIFMKSAKGAYMHDEDGNTYVDLINSWGPMILGHAHEGTLEAVRKAAVDSLSFGTPGAREVEIAQIICDMVPSIEKVRMVNSGTEATMSAIRLARGYTGRDKIIKYEGCYHGHGDSFLIAAGSGAATFGIPNSPGVTKGTAEDTLTAPFNGIEETKALIEANPNQIAAIILEPVAGNMGLVLPTGDFLQGLRTLCDENGIILIFDEVMTGFRLAPGGAQEVFKVIPDLTTLGKIIGGGMPVGAYGGKREIMDYVSPQGPVYQAGTLSGNPVAMAAGIAMLTELKNNPNIYTSLENNTREIAENIENGIMKLGIPAHTVQLGSMMCVYFQEDFVHNFEQAKASHLDHFKAYFHGLLNEGVYLPPSQFESWFISNAIGQQEIDIIINGSLKALQKI